MARVGKKTLQALFARAADYETRCSEIYTELSARCDSVPSVAAFWDSFAKDEINHAEMIQEIHRSLTQQELSAPPTDDQWESLLATEDFLACVKVQSVHDLEEAYELAHEIENYELKIISQLFVNEIIKNNQLVDFMKAQLDEHIHRLEEIGTQWGSVAARRAVRFLK